MTHQILILVIGANDFEGLVMTHWTGTLTFTWMEPIQRTLVTKSVITGLA